MATTMASDFQIYEDQFIGGFIEAETQFTDAFNAASAGTIVNVSEMRRGDYVQESFFKKISDVVTRRDTTSISAATALKVEQGEMATVKLNRKIGPVDSTVDAFRKIQRDQGENGQESLSFLLGSQIAKAIAVERLNQSIRAVVAAMTADVANVEHAMGGNISTAGLTYGLEKMGDAADRIKAWVMHSATYYTLVREQISANVFEVGGFVVHQGTAVTLNRPVIITDSDQLANDDSPTGKYVLGLTAGAVATTDTETKDVVTDLVTGLENLVVRLQGEYAYNIGVKGFTWDIANGAANPTDAALATSTNWDKSVASHKDGPGSRIAVD